MSAWEKEIISLLVAGRRHFRASVLLAAFIFGCVQPVMAGEIHLSAALSLKEVVGELSGGYAKRHPGTTFILNAGPSGVLAKQIENGAPADLFFSANAEWMDYLQDSGMVKGATRFPFACNVLVFVGQKGVKASSLADVAQLEQVAIGSPKTVPAGEYAMEAIRRAGIEKPLERLY